MRVRTGTLWVCVWGFLATAAHAQEVIDLNAPPPSDEVAPPPSQEPADESGGYGAIVTVAGGVAQAVPEVPCAEGRCAGEPIELGAAASARLIGLIDLLGPGLVLDAAPQPSRLASTAGFPAALSELTLNRAGTTSTTLVLLSLREPVTVIWSFLSDVHNAGGGGLSTRELTMRPAQVGEPLEISLFGEALPSPGDQPYRPGPPILFVFRYDVDAGQYVERRE